MRKSDQKFSQSRISAGKKAGSRPELEPNSGTAVHITPSSSSVGRLNAVNLVSSWLRADCGRRNRTEVPRNLSDPTVARKSVRDNESFKSSLNSLPDTAHILYINHWFSVYILKITGEKVTRIL